MTHIGKPTKYTVDLNLGTRKWEISKLKGDKLAIFEVNWVAYDTYWEAWAEKVQLEQGAPLRKFKRPGT